MKDAGHKRLVWNGNTFFFNRMPVLCCLLRFRVVLKGVKQQPSKLGYLEKWKCMTMQGRRELSYLDRLGRRGTMRVVWRAIPWYWRLFVFPYCMFVYRKFFADCASVEDLRGMHIDHYNRSRVFRFFRPKFRLIKRALLPLNAKPMDQGVQKAVTPELPIEQIPARRRSASESDAPA